MQAFTIEIAGGKLHAVSRGHGVQLLICLHGFGEHAESFACLEKELGDVFTIVAFDLPFHGKTKWSKEIFYRTDLFASIQYIADRYHQKRFSILGYSMGGRIGLYITQHFADKIDYLLLLAPDGLHYSPWFLFSTQTRIGRYLFKWNINHPQLFFAILKAGKSLKIVNSSLYKFVFQYMNSAEKREQVYKIWICMQQLMPNKWKVKKQISIYQPTIILFFGKYDRVIPPSLGYSFCKNLPEAKITVLEKGHNVLSEEVGDLIRQNIHLAS